MALYISSIANIITMQAHPTHCLCERCLHLIPVTVVSKP